MLDRIQVFCNYMIGFVTWPPFSVDYGNRQKGSEVTKPIILNNMIK